MSHRRLLVLALIAGLPGFARAQFTTFIPQKNKVADSAKAAVVAQQKAQVDSSIQTQLTNMKTWIDSAAGLVPAPTMTAADSVANAAPTSPMTSPSTPTPSVDSTRFPNGARAPSTASSLPLMMVMGAFSLFVGALLLRGVPIRARHES